MRKLVITDIHGAYKALVQVLERAKFDPQEDQLIFLGDVVDGWLYTTECVELLASFPNLISIRGNHDAWAWEWLNNQLDYTKKRMYREDYQLWFGQGGKATIQSIEKHKSHQIVFDFLDNMKFFHVDNYKLFVHGGVPKNTLVENCDPWDLMWDRTLVKIARLNAISMDPVVPEYDEVWVGHTPVQSYGKTTPTNYSNLWMVDTGASYSGPLSIVDVDSKEVFQSDPVVDLYPGESAR